MKKKSQIYKVQNHFTPDKIHFLHFRSPHRFSLVPKYIFPYTFPFDIELNRDKTVGKEVGGGTSNERGKYSRNPIRNNNEFGGIRHVNFNKIPGIRGAITRFRDARKSCFS